MARMIMLNVNLQNMNSSTEAQKGSLPLLSQSIMFEKLKTLSFSECMFYCLLQTR